MFGVMEVGIRVGGRSVGLLVCFSGVCCNGFRDRPARACYSDPFSR